MATIYDKHANAFNQVSAGVLMVNGECVGTLAFKWPRDGAGRVTCFLHIHGQPMVSGTASGYGYDKSSAALESACGGREFEGLPQLTNLDCGGYGYQDALKRIGIRYVKAV